GGLWIHAVSVGEAMVAATLRPGLAAHEPLVVTTVTPTGQERARRAFGEAATGYLPYELGFAVRRFFDGVRPRALVLVEGDYWPLVLREARRRGVPAIVVNGRISDRSFPRLRWVRWAVRPLLLDPVAHFGVQTALDRDRLLALGVAGERITVTGNLKFEAAPPAAAPELAGWIRQLAGGRPVLVAGSTMAGEERRVLEAFALAREATDALLVLAPRHPERFDEVWREIERRHPDAVRRSLPAAPDARPAVALLDTLGELAAAYEPAQGAFIGGTLVPKGGHNPLEAARFGVPVAVGASMENFREMAEAFDRANAWARVGSARELGELWRRWLLDRTGAQEIGLRGRDLVEANRGALARTLAMLDAHLPAGGRSAG
ncbi:MAG: 3-deoxy-D-manno-octulosonic acid transferase, partial [Thermoanaerobaculia bacterium]|nr:3-deoxy-D-manno-octulosonic acid transferase [Thermoanaerobaculia bacterium]